MAIEQELVTHPDVLEVAVIARGHLKWGERPMAFVALHPDKALKWENKHKEFEVDLKAHARKRLPGFATPEWVAVVSDLPVGRGRSKVLNQVTDFLPENLYRKDSESRIAQKGGQIVRMRIFFSRGGCFIYIYTYNG